MFTRSWSRRVSVVSIPGGGFFCLAGLENSWIVSCRADSGATIGESVIQDIPEEPQRPPAKALNMDDFALLSKKDVGCLQNVFLFDFRPTEE